MPKCKVCKNIATEKSSKGVPYCEECWDALNASPFSKIQSMLERLAPRAQEYVTHIASLCREHGIRLECEEGEDGRASMKYSRIRIPPPLTSVAYGVALHEIGHIVGPMRSGRKLEQETGAWLWAKKSAVEWTRDMERDMRICLGTYFAWADHDRRAWIPPPDHVAWQLIDAGLRVLLLVLGYQRIDNGSRQPARPATRSSA
jgi:hypothetical protein